jgi:hypothetical protein
LDRWQNQFTLTGQGNPRNNNCSYKGGRPVKLQNHELLYLHPLLKSPPTEGGRASAAVHKAALTKLSGKQEMVDIYQGCAAVH